jgi:hypothetical protein
MITKAEVDMLHGVLSCLKNPPAAVSSSGDMQNVENKSEILMRESEEYRNSQFSKNSENSP